MPILDQFLNKNPVQRFPEWSGISIPTLTTVIFAEKRIEERLYKPQYSALGWRNETRHAHPDDGIRQKVPECPGHEDDHLPDRQYCLRWVRQHGRHAHRHHLLFLKHPDLLQCSGQVVPAFLPFCGWYSRTHDTSSGRRYPMQTLPGQYTRRLQRVGYASAQEDLRR